VCIFPIPNFGFGPKEADFGSGHDFTSALAIGYRKI
jgi:hypothetical protein